MRYIKREEFRFNKQKQKKKFTVVQLCKNGQTKITLPAATPSSVASGTYVSSTSILRLRLPTRDFPADETRFEETVVCTVAATRGLRRTGFVACTVAADFFKKNREVHNGTPM
jgi:hypothetical protein